MKTIVETIPGSQMRYKTAGDYWLDPDGTLQIKVVSLPSEKEEFLIALHEFVESWLVVFKKIPIKSIDRFDMDFKGKGEPGDDKKAPYYKQHQIATQVERILADHLKINWDKYIKESNAEI